MWSLSPLPGAGILIKFEVNSEAGQTAGKGAVGVAFTPLQANPAWNSSSAVKGRYTLAPVTGLMVGGMADTIAIAGVPSGKVVELSQL